MSASRGAQSGQLGQMDQLSDATEHQGHQPASPRAADVPENESSSPESPGDIVEGGADAIARQDENRASVDTRNSDDAPGAREGLESGVGSDTDATTLVAEDESSGDEMDWTPQPFSTVLQPAGPGPVNWNSLADREGNNSAFQLSGEFNLVWDTQQGHNSTPEDDEPAAPQSDPNEMDQGVSDGSSGDWTDVPTDEWSEEEDEEEDEEVDLDWERNPQVIPAAGIPITDPAISQIRFVFDTTMSRVDMRQRESLDIRYAPSPWRVVTHASPRDPWRRDTNFMFPSPQHPYGMVAVVSISSEGLRTAIQAMRIVMGLRFGERVLPLGQWARQRAAAWDGHWTYHRGRQGAIRNGLIVVTGYWGWEDPWSPVGARSVLEMMQDVARLHGSWRVLVFIRLPANNSLIWLLPRICMALM